MDALGRISTPPLGFSIRAVLGRKVPRKSPSLGSVAHSSGISAKLRPTSHRYLGPALLSWVGHGMLRDNVDTSWVSSSLFEYRNVAEVPSGISILIGRPDWPSSPAAPRPSSRLAARSDPLPPGLRRPRRSPRPPQTSAGRTGRIRLRCPRRSRAPAPCGRG